MRRNTFFILIKTKFMKSSKEKQSKATISKTIKKKASKVKKTTVKVVKKTTKTKVNKTSKKAKETKQSKTSKPANKKGNNSNLAEVILAKAAKKKISAKTTNSSEPKVQAIKLVEKETKKENIMDNLLQSEIMKKSFKSKSKTTFRVGDYAVYPSHGVGKIVKIENTEVMGQDFSCYLMYFEKERLTIKVPVKNSGIVGLRHLITKDEMEEVFLVLRSGVKKLKGMWSRRAQEYETKINSGDILLLAEVIRDLTRDIEDSERSYSERIIYENAIYRFSSEYAVIFDIPFEEAKDKVIMIAKDKLNSEDGVRSQYDNFDDFDFDNRRQKDDFDEDDSDDEEEEEEDDDFDYDRASAEG